MTMRNCVKCEHCSGERYELAMIEESNMTKKQRRRIRSKHFHDMKPRIFDKLVKYIPHMLKVLT